MKRKANVDRCTRLQGREQAVVDIHEPAILFVPNTDNITATDLLHILCLWDKMLEMVMDLMETAEGMFESGADRKEWVIAMVKGSADTINYDIDIEAISALIDSLCDMSKVVNNSVTPEETPDE